MDNLTHSLVGLFLARTGFNEVTPRGTAILVVAANVPDLDTVSLLGGRLEYLQWHRHFAHSLLAMPLMALVAVAIVRAIGRKPVRWLQAFLIALMGVASHLILDLTNVYGVRLMLPFSGHWYHWDTTPVVDLAIWAILILGIAAPALGRLVGSEIGEKTSGRGKAGWAVAALLLLFAYDYGRSILHDRAVTTADSYRYSGLTPRRSAAFPSANPLVWTGTVELSNAWVQVPVDLRSNFHISDAETFYKPPRTGAIEAALHTEPFERLLEFVQYPLWVTEAEVDSHHDTRVRLLDLRFGTPRESGFTATALISPTDRVVDANFGMGSVRLR